MLYYDDSTGNVFEGIGDSMIIITKINDKELVINSDLIETIESTPDTTITMTTGRKFIAKEAVNEIMEKVVEFRQRISINVK